MDNNKFQIEEDILDQVVNQAIAQNMEPNEYLNYLLDEDRIAISEAKYNADEDDSIDEDDQEDDDEE